MSQLFQPPECFFFWSILYRNDLHQEQELINYFCDQNYAIYRDDFMPQAEYYSKEMGDQKLLSKFYLIDQNPRNRETLVAEKLRSVELENKFSKGERRQVNIDPGYICHENIILTSGKNYGHRVYLFDGVFCELELLYRNQTFEILPWTYPDYQNSEVIEFLNWNRSLLVQKLIKKNS